MDKKLLYPLPRHSCKTEELFLKNNAHENIATKKFNIAMNFANIWERRIFCKIFYSNVIGFDIAHYKIEKAK